MANLPPFWNISVGNTRINMGNLPTIVEQMMGSVGVRQAEITKHDIKSSRGNKRRRRPRRAMKV